MGWQLQGRQGEGEGRADVSRDLTRIAYSTCKGKKAGQAET
jgi:hypothetical protein